MKPTTINPDWIKNFEFQDLDCIFDILSQLVGDYETSTNQSYTNFLLNLEKEIEKRIEELLSSEWTWEQLFSLWTDQAKVREAIMDEYFEQYIP